MSISRLSRHCVGQKAPVWETHRGSMRKNAKGNESSVQCPAERPRSHSEQEESDGDGYTIDHIVRSANLVPGNEHREAQGEGNRGTAHVLCVSNCVDGCSFAYRRACAATSPRQGTEAEVT
jgi:hypothetical protein